MKSVRGVNQKPSHEQWEIIAPLITEPQRREDKRGGSVISGAMISLSKA